MIKLICFDLDGVYFAPVSFQKFKKAFAGDVDELKVNHVLYKSDEMMKFKTGKISEDEYWRYACHELGIEVDKGKIFQTN